MPGFAHERQDQILRLLRARGRVVVTTLARDLGVAELTVRRDLTVLDARGLVRRVHGGATLPGTEGDGASARFTIGLVVPSTEYYWPAVVAGAREAAAQRGVRLVVHASSYDIADDRRHFALLAAAAGIDGIVAGPNLTAAESPALLRWLDRLPVPVVLAERRPGPRLRTGDLEWVASDHAAGAALAVRHLHARGHRRIGLLRQEHSPTSSHLVRGWRDELRALGVQPEEQVQVNTDAFADPAWRREHLPRVVHECRRTGTTALLVQPDPCALDLQDHCVRAGVRIPDDLALVAYDDEVAGDGSPPLTAVRPPKEHVGRLAIELAVARLLEGATRPPHRIDVRPSLTLRGST